MLPTGTTSVTVLETALMIVSAIEIETETETGIEGTATTEMIATTTATTIATAIRVTIDTNHRAAAITTIHSLPDHRKAIVIFAGLTRAGAILSVRLKATSLFALRSLWV